VGEGGGIGNFLDFFLLKKSGLRQPTYLATVASLHWKSRNGFGSVLGQFTTPSITILGKVESSISDELERILKKERRWPNGDSILAFVWNDRG
jgi:hypothetical protein